MDPASGNGGMAIPPSAMASVECVASGTGETPADVVISPAPSARQACRLC